MHPHPLLLVAAHVYIAEVRKAGQPAACCHGGVAVQLRSPCRVGACCSVCRAYHVKGGTLCCPWSGSVNRFANLTGCAGHARGGRR